MKGGRTKRTGAPHWPRRGVAEPRSVIAHRPLNFPSQVRIADLQGFLDTVSPNYLHGLEGKLELVKNLDFGTLKRDNSCLQTRVPLGVV